MARVIHTEEREIPDYTRIGELKRRFRIPHGRDIIELTERGVTRRGDSEETQPGGTYIDAPKYIRGVRNVARVMREIALLKMILPEDMNIITDHPEYTYVLIEDLYLGSDYNPSHTHVLIKLPDEYPQIPPGLNTRYGIYITGGLRRNGQPLQCGKDQYHWNCSHNREQMREKGWAWWCFARFQNWDPHRDDISRIVIMLTETLQNPEQQRFG